PDLHQSARHKGRAPVGNSSRPVNGTPAGVTMYARYYCVEPRIPPSKMVSPGSLPTAHDAFPFPPAPARHIPATDSHLRAVTVRSDRPGHLAQASDRSARAALKHAENSGHSASADCFRLPPSSSGVPGRKPPGRLYRHAATAAQASPAPYVVAASLPTVHASQHHAANAKKMFRSGPDGDAPSAPDRPAAGERPALHNADGGLMLQCRNPRFPPAPHG